MACLVKKMDYLTRRRPCKVDFAYMGFIAELIPEKFAGACIFKAFIEQIFLSSNNIYRLGSATTIHRLLRRTLLRSVILFSKDAKILYWSQSPK